MTPSKQHGAEEESCGKADPAISKTVAKLMLRTSAVTIRPDHPFVFQSGIVSPIYCDNRVIISFPQERKTIIRSMVSVAREWIGIHNIDAVAGTATAGIPYAAWLADKLNLPMVYVRERPKEHGVKKQVEGRLYKGERILVVEDLISTGGSAISTANTLRENGASVESCLAIITYQMAVADEAFKQNGIRLYALCDAQVLLEVASGMKLVDSKGEQIVRAWLAEHGQR